MNLIDCIKNKKQGYLDKKPENFFQVYESHLDHLRNENISLFEIGVRWGGSVWGWRNYFPNASIVGLDIDPQSMQYGTEDPNNGVKLYLGDQTDIKLLDTINDNHGDFDIIIDDGGHTMEQQIKTFDHLWPKLKNGGIYVIEDIHTSYWPEFGGGYKREKTFIEYVKDLIDNINAYHHKQNDKRSQDYKNSEPLNYMDQSIYGLHVYDGIILIHKFERSKPFNTVNL